MYPNNGINAVDGLNAKVDALARAYNNGNQSMNVSNDNGVMYARSKVSEMLQDYKEEKFERIALKNILNAIEEYLRFNFTMTISQESELRDTYKEFVNKLNDLDGIKKEGEDYGTSEVSKVNASETNGNGEISRKIL